MSNLIKEGLIFFYQLIIEQKKRKEEKLEINYLIVIALICEFCNKFVFSVFDTIVSQFGEVKHNLTSFQFR